jgi:hypothetical protein
LQRIHPKYALGLVDYVGKLLANSDSQIVSYSRKCLGFAAALMAVELKLLQQQIVWFREDALRAEE